MRPRGKRGVSTYLEVFLLIGVAIGGSGLVLGAATRYLGSSSGPSVSIVSAAIRQGPYSAVESVAVAESGAGSLGAFNLTTSQAPESAPYCYSVDDPVSGEVLSSTCPGQAVGPGTIEIPPGSVRGGSVLVEVVVAGWAFAPGSSHLVSVTASDGSEASAEVEVVPA